MSQHLDSLVPGCDTLDARGPVGSVEYVRPGVFEHAGRQVVAALVNMVAGGKGITPMFQVAMVGCFGCRQGRPRILCMMHAAGQVGETLTRC